jgi:hypothetical protein
MCGEIVNAAFTKSLKKFACGETVFLNKPKIHLTIQPFHHLAI